MASKYTTEVVLEAASAPDKDTMISDDNATASPPSTIGGRGALYVGIASAFSAAVGYVVMLLATGLGSETSQFLAFWSFLFTCFGILSGISVETTRSVTNAVREGFAPGPRLVWLAVGFAGVLGTLMVLTAPLWRDRAFESDAQVLGWLACAGVVGYAVHSVLVGSLGGRAWWATYSGTIAAESGVRLALVVTVVIIGSTMVGLAAASALAAFTWVVVVAVSRRARAALASRADVPTTVLLPRMLASIAAQGSSAVLVVGFPFLLSLTTEATVYAAGAPLLLAISFTRAPLLIPLNAYQGVAVAHFVNNRDRGLRALLPILRLIGLIGAVGAALAWLVGPWLMVLLTGKESYRVDGWILAALTVGAALLAILTLTGALCQALALHRWFVGGWLLATGVAVALLLVPGPLAVRAVVALVGGPLLGILVHLSRLARPVIVQEDAR